ncbi:hypothetical protein ABW19_dt0209645 [Dactylella cylindrospora]|nr:hypothetical protein ABW19_dt0209645 [Dactylella cylindrospora]
MRPYFGSAVLLLSLSSAISPALSYTYEDGAANPFPSNIDITSRMNHPAVDLSVRSPSSLTMIGAMSKLHQRDTVFSLLRRSYAEMTANTISIPISLKLFPRQAPPTEDPTGSTGSPTMNVEEWDRVVNTACDPPIANLSNIVTQITDPAGVAVCYNIPFYNSSSGAFASDIRLYKIANGTAEWEASGVRMSLSVEYSGAMVQLASVPGSGAAAVNAQPGRLARRQAAQTTSPRLLQTLRFVGQVNPDVMANETMRVDPDIMKLLLIPTLTLVGNSASGTPMNASVAAAQINYVSGAFANITKPEVVAAAEPFVLPGTQISIVPVGMYLFTVYMVLFVLIVGFGSWERYQFRMSYRKRRGISHGKTGVGKI